MSNYLDQINHTGDIKQIPQKAYPELAEEIRKFLIEKVSVTGGHLASNLGTVELTMGIHLALDLPEDKIIWDVGHQSYTHKILTGRCVSSEAWRAFPDEERVTVMPLTQVMRPLPSRRGLAMSRQEIFEESIIRWYP